MNRHSIKRNADRINFFRLPKTIHSFLSVESINRKTNAGYSWKLAKNAAMHIHLGMLLKNPNLLSELNAKRQN